MKVMETSDKFRVLHVATSGAGTAYPPGAPIIELKTVSQKSKISFLEYEKSK
jgi:hypothetical protein